MIKNAPTDVLISPEQTPVPVIVESVKPSMLGTVTKGEGTTLAPTTTEAQDKVTEGQRDINRIWEHTQSRIAMWVTAATVVIIGITILVSAFTGHTITSEELTLINYLVVMTTLILSFYFSRTNHQAVGGVGPKVESEYTGR